YKNSETSSVVSGTPTFQSLASYLSTGTYPIVINKGTLSATNYDFQMVDGKLTVNPGTATPIVNEKDSLIKIYPNPASNVLNIDYQDNFDFSVIDLHGKVITHQKSAKNTVTLPVDQLNEGFYFVKIQNNSVLNVYKVLIKR
ncbi:MAG: T9SS type A sorting domain-containing protein, partial [Paludibacter sp.]